MDTSTDGQNKSTERLRRFSRPLVVILFGFLIGTGLLCGDYLDIKELWKKRPIKVLTSFGLGILVTSFIYITEAQTRK